jgi:hypothetical protein
MSQVVIDRQQEDLEWASNDPEVQRRYVGQYVVPFERRIVAHGTDLEQVLRDAVAVTGKLADELPDCAILDPLEEIPR